MATSAVETFTAGQVLTAAALNSLNTNILDTGPTTLGSPRTANFDFDTFAGFFQDMTAPSTSADNIALYSRDVGGSNLFVREESSGNQIQITNSWDTVIWDQFFS